MTVQDIEASTRAIVARAEASFRQQQERVWRSTDRIMTMLMAGQWVFGIGIALVVSPWAWSGKARVAHMHVWIALILGAILSSLPIALGLLRPGWVVTRHVMVAAQMLWSALLIHLTGGRIETHFHVFGSLGIVAAYRDWPVLLTATVVVATDHLIRGILWPESVYGIVNPEWWRFLEHAFWVVFSASWLTVLCLRSVKDMRLVAERSAELEALSESEWLKSSVLDRTDPPKVAAS